MSHVFLRFDIASPIMERWANLPLNLGMTAALMEMMSYGIGSRRQCAFVQISEYFLLEAVYLVESERKSAGVNDNTPIWGPPREKRRFWQYIPSALLYD